MHIFITIINYYGTSNTKYKQILLIQSAYIPYHVFTCITLISKQVITIRPSFSNHHYNHNHKIIILKGCRCDYHKMNMSVTQFRDDIAGVIIIYLCVCRWNWNLLVRLITIPYMEFIWKIFCEALTIKNKQRTSHARRYYT